MLQLAHVIYGDREVVDQMLFGGVSPQLTQYIQQTNQYFSGMLSDVGRAFVDTAQQTFARMDSSEAMRVARAALRMANTYFQQDVIYGMTEISQLQEAPDCMVRWIMCHPTLRELYAENSIEAYGKRYMDVQPKQGNDPIATGWDHVDYRQVYNGWITPVVETTIDERRNEHQEYFEEYITCLDPEEDYDVQLLDEECVDIMAAHELVSVAIQKKRDPTSYYDSQIL